MKDIAVGMRALGRFKSFLRVESIGLGGRLEGEGEVRLG